MMEKELVVPGPCVTVYAHVSMLANCNSLFDPLQSDPCPATFTCALDNYLIVAMLCT